MTAIEDNLQCCALTYAAIESVLREKAVDVQEYYRKYVEE